MGRTGPHVSGSVLVRSGRSVHSGAVPSVRRGRAGPTGPGRSAGSPALPGGSKGGGPAEAKPGKESQPFIGPEGGRSHTERKRETPITSSRRGKCRKYGEGPAGACSCGQPGPGCVRSEGRGCPPRRRRWITHPYEQRCPRTVGCQRRRRLQACEGRLRTSGPRGEQPSGWAGTQAPGCSSACLIAGPYRRHRAARRRA
jgi:hypothetical protein